MHVEDAQEDHDPQYATTLGMLNVALFLPLPNAVAHNGVAALLLAQMLWLAWCSKPRRAPGYG